MRVHVPMHTKAREMSFAAYSGWSASKGDKYGLDGSIAITDRLAVKAGGMLSGESFGSRGAWDISIGAFTNDDDTSSSLAGWLIYGSSVGAEDDPPYLYSSKYGFQIDAGLQGETVEGLAAFRYVWVNFPPLNRYESGTQNYLEPTLGIRVGSRELKLEMLLTMVVRTDRSSHQVPFWLTTGLYARL
jgi:hypothetical protein